MEGLGEVPPIKLVGGAPAIVPHQGFNPIGAVSDQKQMPCPADGQMGFTLQE